MIAMIFAAVAFAFCVCGAYFYKCSSEAYRELERAFDKYIENLNKEFDAKNTATKGA
mgnify:CR=1 FL=1